MRGGSRSCLADNSGGRGLDVGHGPFDDFVGSVPVEVVAQNNGKLTGELKESIE